MCVLAGMIELSLPFFLAFCPILYYEQNRFLWKGKPMVMSMHELMKVQEQIKHISCEEARNLLDKDDVLFVDVRSIKSFESGHITGSAHCERGVLEFLVADDSPMQLQVFHGLPYRQYIVYCDRGRQSALAAKTLQDMGVPNVYNLMGGYEAWNTLVG